MADSKREQLMGLGGPDHEATGALIRAAQNSEVGVEIAAGIVIAMANSIGEELLLKERAMRMSDARETRVAMAAIHELAGKLGLKQALDTLIEQPLPGEAERTIITADDTAQDPEAIAVQLAILRAVDGTNPQA